MARVVAARTRDLTRRPIEVALADLDQRKVAHNHRGQRGEETRWERVESQRGGERSRRQDRAYGDDTERGKSQGNARMATKERRTACSDREDHQGLRRK